MKRLFLLSLVLLLINGCSDSNDTIDEEVVVDPVLETFAITGEYTPGDIIQIKSNKTLKLSSIDVILNNSNIKAYKMNEFTYVFTLPVIPSGKYDLKLPTIDKNLILNLTVKDYTPINNPEEVIAEYIINRDKCFDEMTKNTSVVQTPVSPETLLMIDQIKQEWDFQFSKNSNKDKELLAYILQKQQINPDWFSFQNELPANYYNKLSAPALDAGDMLVSIAKVFVTFQVICVGSVPFLLGSGAIFLIAPNPITAALFLISFSTFVIAREVAERNAMAVGSLKGVAEEISEMFTQKTAAIELINDVEKNIGMNVNFRNLKSTDATIQADINTAFIGESELVAKDNEVKVLYQKAVQFTSKIKGLFPSYTPAIGKTSERNIVLPILGSDIIIKGSSDPNVTVTSKIEGDNSTIKVSSTSTQNINFNLKVAYKRKIDGQEVVKDIACVFKPSSISLAGDLDFGEKLINSSTKKSFTITNQSNTPITITSIALPNGFISNWPGGNILTSGSKQVEITFNPIEAKDYSGTIVVKNNIDESDTTIGVTAIGSKGLTLLGDLNFGEVVVDKELTKSLILVNGTKSDIHVSSINLPTGYKVDWASGTIGVSGSVTVYVTFKPTQVKDYLGEVVVNNDIDQINNKINISGVGVGDGNIDLSGTWNLEVLTETETCFSDGPFTTPLTFDQNLKTINMLLYDNFNQPNPPFSYTIEGNNLLVNDTRPALVVPCPESNHTYTTIINVSYLSENLFVGTLTFISPENLLAEGQTGCTIYGENCTVNIRIYK